MKIKRMINGFEYEFVLTNKELSDAYKEKSDEIDIKTVIDEINRLPTSIFRKVYGCTKAYAKKKASLIAKEMRNNINTWNMDMDNAMEDAFREILIFRNIV